MNMDKKEYGDYVRKISKKSPILKNCFLAFIFGGGICCIGQFILNFFILLGLDKNNASMATSITLVFLGAFLTGANVYPKLAKYAGAGTIVPITGFANSVTAPALEANTEGLVLGVGTKIFTIAGPVILYGTLASFFCGIVYYILEFCHKFL